jgi:hypothetical protein
MESVVHAQQQQWMTGVVRALSSVSPSHSRDSAIDSDLAEFETDTLEVNLVRACCLSTNMHLDMRCSK